MLKINVYKAQIMRYHSIMLNNKGFQEEVMVTLTLQFSGVKKQKVTVNDVKTAQVFWRAFIGEFCLRASDMRGTCGDLVDENDVKIGHLSYNGRAWQNNGAEMEA